MRIAVCVSSQIRGNAFDGGVREYFNDADFFFGVWQDEQEEFNKIFPEEECILMQQPDNYYHPYLDVSTEGGSERFKSTVSKAKIKPSLAERYKFQMNQLFAHKYMLEVVKGYDMVVRARYDTLIPPGVDLSEYIEQAKTRAVGFGVSRKQGATVYCKPDNDQFLADHMIIHTPEQFNHKKMMDLYENRELRGAEFGWAQILGDNDHLSIDGLVGLKRDKWG